MTTKQPPGLTGNDIAVAEMACGLAVAWWKQRKGGGAYKRDEMAKLKALIAKLSAISQHAYPYVNSDDMPENIGAETLMAPDRAMMNLTRKEARRRTLLAAA